MISHEVQPSGGEEWRTDFSSHTANVLLALSVLKYQVENMLVLFSWWMKILLTNQI